MLKPVVTFSDDGSETAKIAKLFLEELSERGCIVLISVRVNSFAIYTNKGVVIKNLKELEFFYNSFSVV